MDLKIAKQNKIVVKILRHNYHAWLCFVKSQERLEKGSFDTQIIRMKIFQIRKLVEEI